MRVSRFVLTIAGIACLAMFSGCPGTDPLGSSFSELTSTGGLDVSASTRWDGTRLQIQQILVQPTDPAARAAAGSAPIGLSIDAVVADFTATSSIVLGSGNLPAGSYDVVGMRITVFNVNDTSLPAGPSTCLENFDMLPPDYSDIDIFFPVNAVDVVPTGTVSFLIGGTSATLEFAFDMEIIGNAMEAGLARFCQPTNNCSYGFGKTKIAPCILRGFDTTLFTDALVGAVHIVTP